MLLLVVMIVLLLVVVMGAQEVFHLGMGTTLKEQ